MNDDINIALFMGKLSSTVGQNAVKLKKKRRKWTNCIKMNKNVSRSDLQHTQHSLNHFPSIKYILGTDMIL